MMAKRPILFPFLWWEAMRDTNAWRIEAELLEAFVEWMEKAKKEGMAFTQEPQDFMISPIAALSF